jgi:hypothetical protein
LQVVSANFKTHTLAQPREGLLVLKPSLGSRLFGVTFAGLGSIFLAILVARPVTLSEPGGWMPLVGGLLFVAIGAGLFWVPARHEFNRNTDTYRKRRLVFLQRVRPLTDVLAVQLIHGGFHTQDSDSGPKESYRSYQLNLVVSGGPARRLNLTNHSALATTTQTGHRIAKFLGVPLLDKVSEDDA